MTADRSDRKVQRRALIEAGVTLVSRGLRRRPSLDELTPLAAVLHAELLPGPRAGGPVRAAELAWQAYEASVAGDAAGQGLACRKGCTWCCHNAVSVTAPEAFAMAAAIAAPKSVDARAVFSSGLAATRGRSALERFGRKIPCALLSAGACSVYLTRPLACRRVTAFDVAPCIEEFNGVGGEMSVPDGPIAHGTSVQLAMLAALVAAGRPAVLYEMSSAVEAVQADPNSSQRWQAGDNVFGTAANDAPLGADALRPINEIARRLQAVFGRQ